MDQKRSSWVAATLASKRSVGEVGPKLERAVVVGGERHDELLLISLNVMVVPPRSESWSRSGFSKFNPPVESSRSTIPENLVYFLEMFHYLRVSSQGGDSRRPCNQVIRSKSNAICLELLVNP